jgi:hypothetical protein
MYINSSGHKASIDPSFLPNMVCITRSQARFASGQQAKYVLEQPPVLFTLVNILANQNMKQEALALKQVFKSNVSNEIIDKAFASTRYTYHYTKAVQEKKERFIKTVAHWLALGNDVCGTSKKYRIKIQRNLFTYLVANKDMVDIEPRFKEVVLLKLSELAQEEPSITLMMNNFRTQLM